MVQISLLTGALALASYGIVTVSGADCWPADANNNGKTNGKGINLAWQTREFACNEWWRAAAGSNSRWVFYPSKRVISSYYYWQAFVSLQGMTSQQQCWDATENILNQCAWAVGRSDGTRGGDWNLGGTHVTAGYYQDGPCNCAYPEGRKRSVADAKNAVEGPSVGFAETYNITGPYTVVLFNPESGDVVSKKLYSEDGTVTALAIEAKES